MANSFLPDFFNESSLFVTLKAATFISHLVSFAFMQTFELGVSMWRKLLKDLIQLSFFSSFSITI
jgi:hypothetical protein